MKKTKSIETIQLMTSSIQLNRIEKISIKGGFGSFEEQITNEHSAVTKGCPPPNLDQ